MHFHISTRLVTVQNVIASSWKNYSCYTHQFDKGSAAILCCIVIIRFQHDRPSSACNKCVKLSSAALPTSKPPTRHSHARDSFFTASLSNLQRIPSDQAPKLFHREHCNNRMWSKSRIICQPPSKKTPAAIPSHHPTHNHPHSYIIPPSSSVVHHDRLHKVSRRRDGRRHQSGDHRRAEVELQAVLKSRVFHQRHLRVIVGRELRGAE